MTINHDPFDITVPNPPTPDMGPGNLPHPSNMNSGDIAPLPSPIYGTWLPTPLSLPTATDIWWSILETCSLVHLRTHLPTHLILRPSGGHQNTYGLQVGGTHPTGMLSCFLIISTMLVFPSNLLMILANLFTVFNEMLRFTHFKVISTAEIYSMEHSIKINCKYSCFFIYFHSWHINTSRKKPIPSCIHSPRTVICGPRGLRMGCKDI